MVFMLSNNWKTGVRLTKVKTLLSQSLTGTFPMKNYACRENCDSRAWVNLDPEHPKP